VSGANARARQDMTTGEAEAWRALIEAKSIPEPNSGCWLWMGSQHSAGYGVFQHAGKNLRAHRLSAEAWHGQIPPGMLVCHRCDNPPCVNPEHLFIGTPRDNARDCVAKGRNFVPKVVPPTAKITRTLAQAIYDGDAGAEHAAFEAGLTAATIRRIKRGRFWAVGALKPATGRKLPKIAADVEAQVVSAVGTQREIAARMGISQRTVGRIRRAAIRSMEAPHD
jgi:hypothetical protein